MPLWRCRAPSPSTGEAVPLESERALARRVLFVYRRHSLYHAWGRPAPCRGRRPHPIPIPRPKPSSPYPSSEGVRGAGGVVGLRRRASELL